MKGREIEPWHTAASAQAMTSRERFRTRNLDRPAMLNGRQLVQTTVVIVAATLSPWGSVLEEQSDVAPPLTEATAVQGVLQFGAGARDWREAQLRTASPEGAIALYCRHFLAHDACFHLAEAEALDGVPATVWLHHEQGVLQLDAGGRRIIGYSDTVRRFTRFTVSRGKPLGLYVLSACLLCLVGVLFATGQWRSWKLGRSKQ
jgi:hypothetical protein